MTASLLPNGKQQFIDINGKPLVAGTVGMFRPTTLIAKNTWQDPDMNVLNTNPIRLDSRGQALIYGVGNYRQIVKDALGNLIWDELTTSLPNPDAITAVSTTAVLLTLSADAVPSDFVETLGRDVVGDKGGGAFQVATNQALADNGGTIRKGASGIVWEFASPQKVTSYLFGVVADGVTNDTAPLQRALDWLASNIVYISTSATLLGQAVGYTPLLYVQGNILLSSSITIPPYAKIDFTGSQLISGTDGITVVKVYSRLYCQAHFNAYGTGFLWLNNLTINGNGKKGIGVDWDTIYQCEILNCQVVGFTGTTAVSATATLTSGNSTIVTTDGTQFTPGKIYLIAGGNNDGGFAQPYSVVSVVGNNVVVSPTPATSTAAAAVTLASVAHVGRMAQQSLFLNMNTQLCDWEAVWTNNEDGYPSGDMRIISSFAQRCGSGPYLANTYLMRHIACSHQFYSARPHLTMDACNASIFDTDYIENGLTSTSAIPMVVICSNSNGTVFNDPYMLFNGHWRRGFTNYGTLTQINSITGNKDAAIENPGHGGDFALVSQLSGTLIMDSILNFTNLLGVPSSWVVNAGFAFPTGSVTCVQNAGTAVLYAGLPIADPSLFQQLYTDGTPSAGTPKAVMMSGG